MNGKLNDDVWFCVNIQINAVNLRRSRRRGVGTMLANVDKD